MSHCLHLCFRAFELLKSLKAKVQDASQPGFPFRITFTYGASAGWLDSIRELLKKKMKIHTFTRSLSYNFFALPPLRTFNTATESL
jgi:hypothetical protein